MHKPTWWTAGLAGLAATAMIASSAALAEVKLRIQAAVPSKADEAVMLGEFAKDVSDLTNGELTLEILPAAQWSASRTSLTPSIPDSWMAVSPGLITGRASIQPRCCSDRRWQAPGSESTTSPSSRGSCTAAERNSTTSSGRRWAST